MKSILIPFDRTLLLTLLTIEVAMCAFSAGSLLIHGQPEPPPMWSLLGGEIVFGVLWAVMLVLVLRVKPVTETP